MAIEGVDVGEAPLQDGIDVLVGPRRAIGVAPYGQDGPPPDAFLPMTCEFGRPDPRELRPEGAFATQIFGPHLGARHVQTIVQRVEFGSALINGVDELMDHRLVRVELAGHVLLADEDFGNDGQLALALPFPVEHVGQGGVRGAAGGRRRG